MRTQIIQTAKSYVNTPYCHQGRVKNAGIDCCGLIICVARELGLSDYDVTGYTRYADGVDLLKEFTSQCEETEDPLPGDILIFKIKRSPQHCGVISKLDGYISLIHAYSSVGKCCEHVLDEFWLQRVVKAFKFPHVQ